jgi:hypothetical protein
LTAHYYHQVSNTVDGILLEYWYLFGFLHLALFLEEEILMSIIADESCAERTKQAADHPTDSICGQSWICGRFVEIL